MNRYLLSILLLGTVLAGCIDPITFDIEENTRLLVVDGMLTDAEGPYKVRLSWSTDLTSDTFPPVENASVVIEEQNGASETLSENMPGLYETSLSGLRGQPGKSYRLLITLANGTEYSSGWEILKASPAIDSIYFNFESKITPKGLKNGVQIYLDTDDPEGNTRYYRWQWTETWKYRVPLSSPNTYAGNLGTSPIEEKEVCYISAPSDQINVATSINNSSDIIANHPLVYVTSETNRLQQRYSILVNQLAINEKEFLFWSSLEDATENAGSLFDRQPQSLTGNVKNSADPQEPVLGYFTVAGISEKRAYFNRYQLPDSVSPDFDFIYSCYNSIDTFFISPTLDQEVFKAMDQGKVFWGFYQPEFFIEGILMTDKECSDCTTQGGSTEVPDFWEE